MHRKMQFLLSLIVVFLLSACDSNETNLSELPSPVAFFEEEEPELKAPHSLQDGIYFAKEDVFNDEGWKHTLSFEVYNSEIINISFNAANESAASTKKDLSLIGIYTLQTEGEENVLRWDEQVELLQNYILSHQGIDSIQILEDGTTDSIPNFTLDIQPFIDLVTEAIEVGPIEIGPFIDGFYFAEQEEFNNGFKYFIRLIIQNGHIIAVHWNGINEDGVRLLTDFNLEDTEDTWREQATRLERFLIEIQDPTQMTFDADNKTDDIFGVSIEVNDFIELAVQALASGPLLPEEN